ncbi:thymidine kinase [Cricetid gammaherpesvirus 2]|uniref:Thymidine kinase n=1 Tax=Cricetid gammaherpesvirus 2 TaxID=1605972 RepID=E9M5K4_9GAMA|nr:thymidine kinase [Cricetid gammaherpesvirus 2]ADW24362.1 thymidine kinase [Cricetid gammaherpesvirus 2]ADW24444.1 thymidine kinase [Cricetid gammaherpesvirus 2]
MATYNRSSSESDSDPLESGGSDQEEENPYVLPENDKVNTPQLINPDAEGEDSGHVYENLPFWGTIKDGSPNLRRGGDRASRRDGRSRQSSRASSRGRSPADCLAWERPLPPRPNGSESGPGARPKTSRVLVRYPPRCPGSSADAERRHGAVLPIGDEERRCRDVRSPIAGGRDDDVCSTDSDSEPTPPVAPAPPPREKVSRLGKLRGSLSRMVAGKGSEKTVEKDPKDQKTVNFITSMNGPMRFLAQVLRPCPDATFRHTYTVFFEGGIASGKTTAMLSAKEEGFSENILVVPEAQVFWNEVLENTCSGLYSVIKKGERGRATSASLLAHQMAFSIPFRTTREMLDNCSREPIYVQNHCNNYVLLDRHLLSPTVIFPFNFFLLRLMCLQDLVTCMSTFSATEMDTVVLMTVDAALARARIKRRGRKAEEGIKTKYLESLNVSINCVHNAWSLLNFLSPGTVVEALFFGQQPRLLFRRLGYSDARSRYLEGLFANSLFGHIRETIGCQGPDTVLASVLHGFCVHLQKIVILKVDADIYSGDVEGLWKDVYEKIQKSPAIKTCYLHWQPFAKYASSLKR